MYTTDLLVTVETKCMYWGYMSDVLCWVRITMRTSDWMHACSHCTRVESNVGNVKFRKRPIFGSYAPQLLFERFVRCVLAWWALFRELMVEWILRITAVVWWSTLVVWKCPCTAALLAHGLENTHLNSIWFHVTAVNTMYVVVYAVDHACRCYLTCNLLILAVCLS
jgi:hypothetical protein